MLASPLPFFIAFVLQILLVFLLVVRVGGSWGSSSDERALELPGDRYFGDRKAPRVVMTRAVSINAAPEVVWPWLAQLGRGAGWYSHDLIDNGARASARHIVSWIPEPRLGDATPIGYLRHLESGVSLVWWVKGLKLAWIRTRLAVDLHMSPQPNGSRLVVRVSADAKGTGARLLLLGFQFVDSIMAIKQLSGIRQRVERHTGGVVPVDPETGAADQYQFYEVIYASGETAGVRGKERAADSRRAAIEDGILTEATSKS